MEVRRARSGTREIFEFDPGMPESDSGAGQDGEGGEPDEAPAAVGQPGEQQSEDGEAERREMGVTLPPAHVAGVEMAPIFRGVGAREQSGGYGERERLRLVERGHRVDAAPLSLTQR